METGRRSWWPWALLGGLAFVVVAVRTLGETGLTFLQGDLALLHVDSLRAAGLHQLLGPYDRFGWHHPGPAYAYLISIADRVVGFRHPLQAEALTALAINSVSLAAAAAVARRHLGPGAAVGILALGWLAVVDLGNDAVFNPWSPTVVVLPTLLVGVLALAAVVSRPRAAGVADGMALLVGALLMLTFCLQSDLGTLPFVAPAVAVIVSVTVAVPLARRWPSVPSSEPTARPAPARWARSWIAVLTAGALITVAAWIPVLVQQWWSDQGNLTRIIRFFTAGHQHAGLAAGIRAAGWAQLAVFGRRPPGAPPVGGDGSWAALGVVLGAAVLLAFGVGRRRPALMAGAAFWLVGTGLAVLAGAEIVGPPYSYLTYWAAAPLVGGAVAVGDLMAGLVLGERSDAAVGTGRREGALLLIALLGSLAVTGDVLARRPVVSYSPAAVATAWSDVGPLISSSGAVGVAYPNQAATWNVGTGLVDRLEAGGHPVAVLPFWVNQVATTSTRPPSRWISVLPAGSPRPGTAWRPAGTVGAVRLFVGSRPAPGTG